MPGQILINNYTTEKIFLRNLFFENGTYTNSTGSTVTINAGTVMGQILATGLWLPNVSTATDGSEMPRRIAGDTYVVLNGATVVIALCVKGDVNKNMITLGGSDTWDTAVRTVTTGGGTIQALLEANSGIVLVPSTELTNYDNG